MKLGSDNTPVTIPSVETATPPSRYTPAEAVARILEQRKGNFLPEGVTIRSLIDEGRA